MKTDIAEQRAEDSIEQHRDLMGRIGAERSIERDDAPVLTDKELGVDHAVFVIPALDARGLVQGYELCHGR